MARPGYVHTASFYDRNAFDILNFKQEWCAGHVMLKLLLIQIIDWATAVGVCGPCLCTTQFYILQTKDISGYCQSGHFCQVVGPCKLLVIGFCVGLLCSFVWFCRVVFWKCVWCEWWIGHHVYSASCVTKFDQRCGYWKCAFGRWCIACSLLIRVANRWWTLGGLEWLF